MRCRVGAAGGSSSQILIWPSECRGKAGIRGGGLGGPGGKCDKDFSVQKDKAGKKRDSSLSSQKKEKVNGWFFSLQIPEY